MLSCNAWQQCLEFFFFHSPGNMRDHCHFYNHFRPEVWTKVSHYRLTDKINFDDCFIYLSCRSGIQNQRFNEIVDEYIVLNNRKIDDVHLLTHLPNGYRDAGY
jgi:hypothetical protein